MNIDFETPMSALFDHMVAAASIPFSADCAVNGPTLSNVTSFVDLFAGLPVFGPGVASGAKIQALDEQARTITLTEAVAIDGTAADFTTGFLTTGRRVKHWTQVPDQPAFFLRRTGVTDEAAHENFFTITTLEGEAWIYCNAGQDPNVAPDSVLTGLERLIRASLEPDGDYGDPRFTLGGLVHWCRIEGKSDISPGDQGPQAIARIPIRITLP
jgi:hypothetical protein